MTKTCRGFCEKHYSKIIRKSLAGLNSLQRFRYIFCKHCETYFKWASFKSYLCPCCHDFMRKVKQCGKRFLETPEHKARRIIQNRNYYQRNKDKWKVYRKKVMEEPLLITVPV